MPEHEPPTFESAKAGIRSRINSQRISVPAVLGVLLFMVSAILFGIWGPRMQQRNTLSPGIPLKELVDAVINDFAISLYGIQQSRDTTPVGAQDALGVIDGTFGEGVALPNLDGEGWELMRARPIGSLDGAEGASGVRLIYSSPDNPQEEWLVIHLIPDPQRWSHYDALGRQVIFSPGARIDEILEFDLGRQLGISLICRDGYLIAVTSLNPDDAATVADVLEEVDTPSTIDGIEESKPSHGSPMSDSAKISLLKYPVCRSAQLRGTPVSA